MAIVRVSELRADLDGVLERVADGEQVVVVQDDEPVAVLVHPSALRDRAVEVTADVVDELVRRLGDAPQEPSDSGGAHSGGREASMLEQLRDDWESRH